MAVRIRGHRRGTAIVSEEHNVNLTQETRFSPRYPNHFDLVIRSRLGDGLFRLLVGDFLSNTNRFYPCEH